MAKANPKPIADYPDLLTCKMVSEILQVGYTKALRLVRYEMPYIQIGNTRRLKKDVLIDWINNSSMSSRERFSDN
jgi:hypothetical protein